MDRVANSQQQDLNSAVHLPIKRKKIKEVDAVMFQKLNTCGKNMRSIDSLPDDLVIKVLSRMSVKEAMRTSVLSRRWRNLWKYTYGTLEFDARSTCNKGAVMKSKEFEDWVDHVVKVHKGSQIDGFIARFNLQSGTRAPSVDRWIRFAMRNQLLKVFELRLILGIYTSTRFKFPNIEEWSRRFTSPFHSLTMLRLIGVNIKDEAVHWFLASCPHLEHLCIKRSETMKNLRIIDPLPKLKFLEIYECNGIQSMEISVVSLISCTYYGWNGSCIPFKNVPNLSELTLGKGICSSFILEPSQHTSYSGHLVKLVLDVINRVPSLDHPLRDITLDDFPQMHSLKKLEVNTYSAVEHSLLFFTLLIKACPLLQEFKIKIDYMLDRERISRILAVPFHEVRRGPKFCNENLKVVEISGFVGCRREKEFLSKLFRRAPFLETVVIDTMSRYYGEVSELVFPYETVAKTRMEAKERAKMMGSNFPPRVKLVII